MVVTEDPPELVMLRESVRRFIATELPGDRLRQIDRSREFPRELFRRLADLGVCGLTIDEQYGGAGRDLVAAVAVVEELCRVGLTLGGPYVHCAFYAGMNISEHGSDSQKAALLPRIARGELLFAYGLSEPDVGADLASVRTTANRAGNRIRINGTKRWCTAVRISDYIYTLCRSDGSLPRYQNLSLVLVPVSAPGITIRDLGHVGITYAATTDVTFDDVEVSIEDVVGGADAWNCGWPMLLGTGLDVEKLEVAAMTLGLMTGAVEQATAYAQSRVQFGKPVSAFQSVRHSLADAHSRLLACRLMVYHAASLAQRGLPFAKESSMAKLFVCDTALQVGIACQQVMGAYGCSDDYDVARFVNDLLVMPILGGSSAIQRNNISKQLDLRAR